MPDSDGPLAQARAALTRDTRGRWPEELDRALAHRRWWLDQWADGAPHVLGLVAQDVQESVHEADPLWPPCSETSCPQRGAHPLYVEPDLGPDPFWTCTETGLPVARVGQLP